VHLTLLENGRFGCLIPSGKSKAGTKASNSGQTHNII